MDLLRLWGDSQFRFWVTSLVQDDPILAATQTAYLPRLPHHAQEGWVRVTPDDAGSQGTTR